MQTSISRMHLKMQLISRARPWSLCLQRIGCAAKISEIRVISGFKKLGSYSSVRA